MYSSEQQGKNNSWWLYPAPSGVVSPLKGVVFLICGICGLLMNLLAFTGLGRCKLTFSTLILMKLQCTMNIIGLLAKTLCNPIVCLTGKPFPPMSLTSKDGQYNLIGSLIFQLPGGMLVIAIYGQFALQAMMAINRFVAICHREKVQVWFNHDRSMLYGALCVMHGVWNLVMCMFPCCPLYFHESQHKWTYKGWGSGWRQNLTVASDLIMCPTMIICYGMTFYKLKKLRSQMSDSGKAELKREVKVLLQFFITACTWLGYSAAYRPLYFFPTIRAMPEVVIISEFVRFWMFSVDPIIYFIFMKNLRAFVVRICTFGQVRLEGDTSVVGTHKLSFATSQRGSLVPGHKASIAASHKGSIVPRRKDSQWTKNLP